MNKTIVFCDTHNKELDQANAIARMYPHTVQGSGGATINGKTCLWDYKNQTMVLKPEKARKKK